MAHGRSGADSTACYGRIARVLASSDEVHRETFHSIVRTVVGWSRSGKKFWNGSRIGKELVDTCIVALSMRAIGRTGLLTGALYFESVPAAGTLRRRSPPILLPPSGRFFARGENRIKFWDGTSSRFYPGGSCGAWARTPKVARRAAISWRIASNSWLPASSASAFAASRPMKNVASVAVR